MNPDLRKKRWWLCLLLLSGVYFQGCEPRSRVLPTYPYADLHFTGPFAVSEDGKQLLVSANEGWGHEDSSIVAFRDAMTTKLSGVMFKSTPRVKQIEFVSDKFGFLLAKSTDPDEAVRHKWPVLPSSLEQVQWNGERRVVVDGIAHPICSLALSADRELAVICTEAVGDPSVAGVCSVYSLLDGRQLSSFELPDARNSMAAFVGKSRQLVVVSDSYHPNLPRACLVDGEKGELLHVIQLATDAKLTGLVAIRNTRDVFLSQTSGVFRLVVEDGQLQLTVFHTENLLGEPGMNSQWMAVDSNGESLAVGETDAGSEQRAGTQIIDIATGARRMPVVDQVGPMRFSTDGKRLYFPECVVDLDELSLPQAPQR